MELVQVEVDAQVGALRRVVAEKEGVLAERVRLACLELDEVALLLSDDGKKLKSDERFWMGTTRCARRTASTARTEAR